MHHETPVDSAGLRRALAARPAPPVLAQQLGAALAAHGWVSLGDALRVSGRPREAVEAYSRAVLAGVGAAWFGLGLALEELGRTPAAERAYRAGAAAGAPGAAVALAHLLRHEAGAAEGAAVLREAARAGDADAAAELARWDGDPGAG